MKKPAKKSLTFAEAQILLSDDDKTTTHNVSKLLLFNDQLTWIKRASDFTMGAYDGTEVSELVRNYLLCELWKLYEKKDIGLYGDNELAVFRNKNGPELEKK